MEEENNLNKSFKVIFWGNFIPLQGVEFIIDAARILLDQPDIKFTIIGSGQTKSKILKKSEGLENVNFIGRVSYFDLPLMIKDSDVCLGIFGVTDKAQRVIPNKVYEAMAMAKPIITADSPAAKELLTDRENVLLCQPGNGSDLADKILLLKNNIDLRSRIAINGNHLFNEQCSPLAIGRNLSSILSRFK